MTVLAAYECEDISDSSKRALSLIHFIVFEHEYKGRLLIRVDAKHPFGSPVNPENTTTSICVSFNTEDVDPSEFSDDFQASLDLISDSQERLEQCCIYNHRNTYFYQRCYECHLNDDDALLLISVWAPDDGAEDFLVNFTALASDIWSSFTENQILH
jgi:hypothetical protein